MSYGNNAIYCSEPNSIPKGPHWAIIEGSSVHIPGDERSRTHPGHGYPESTQSFVTYKAFMNEEDWKKEVERLTTSRYGSKPFVAMYVQPATVTTQTVVSVSTTAQQNFGSSGGSRC